MTLHDELREIEKLIADCGPAGFESSLLRIATEYRELLADATQLLADVCNGWGVEEIIQDFLARLEGERQ